MARLIKIATRKSRMAQTQSRLVGEALVKAFPDFSYELVLITSTGDKSQAWHGDLSKDGGKGAFTKEIEEAVLAGEADIAVHSMKDVPTDIEHPDLVFPAMLPRGDKRDIAVCRKGQSFERLKNGARVGTSSVRRKAQLRKLFPYLEVVHFRGNVDSRIEKLDNGEVDALMLSKAGMDMLSLQDRITTVFEPDLMMPCAQQGAVGAQCRSDNHDVITMLKAVNHDDTMICIEAERAMLRKLEGNCFSPIAGYCEVTKGGNLRMLAMVASVDGSQVIRSRVKLEGQEPIALGTAVAQDLLDQGAAALIQEAARLKAC